MTLGANSYGSAAGVAGYVPLYTDNGSFTTATNPTTATVEGWLDEVSAIANTALKSIGFSVPLTQTDAKLSLQGLINQQVSDLCHAAHGTGRFFSERAIDGNLSSLGMIRKELLDFININAAGWEALGANRAASERDEISFRSHDNSGNATFPIFQREGFGNTFTDWDAK